MVIDNYNPATWDDEKPVLPEDFNKWEQTLKALTEELNRHMSVPNDHKLTKNDLGLGSVFNYGLATDAEASAGTSKVKYMSPYLVSLAITALQSIKSVNGRTGIIQLSKTDVGLGNVKDYDTATNAQALDGSLATLYMTPLTTKAAIEKFAQTIANQAETNAKNYALPLAGGEMSGQIASTAQTPIQARMASGGFSWARGKQVAGTKVKVELRENNVYTRYLEIIVGSGLGASSESGDFTINAWSPNETTLTGTAPMVADNVRYYINDQVMTLGYMQLLWWHRVTRNADNTKNYLQFSAPLDVSGIGGISGPGVNFLQSYLRLNGKDVALNEDLKAHTDDTIRHITAAERLDWNGKETPATAQVKANQAETNAKNYSLANTGGTMKGAINSEAVIALAGKVGEIKHYIAPQPDGTKIRFDIFEGGVWSRGLDIVVGEGNIVGDGDFFIMPLTSTSSYIVGFGPITSQKSRATIIETGGVTLAGSAFTVVWWIRILRNYYDTCVQAYKNLIFSGYGNSQLEKVEFKTTSLLKNGKEVAIVDDVSAIQSSLTTHTGDTIKHVTSAERTNWNAKETVSGAQEKANAAIDTSKSYTDTSMANHANDVVKHLTASERTDWNAKETPTGAQGKANTAENNAKSYTDSYFTSKTIVSNVAVYLSDTQSYTWNHVNMKKGLYIEVVRYQVGTGSLDYGKFEIFLAKDFIDRNLGKACWLPMPQSVNGEKKAVKFTVSGSTGTITGYASNAASPDSSWAISNIRME
ncbi:hypothetical protein HCJ66_00935 [Listeria sp. FSL L7-1582]|uniref:hypothetical protein n=1 Tax=Listeria portnoyi TaxID=2713504 RepID=UPI00164E524B|nr:hypothetical protein [Listeria portnoyi]MBC6308106.1 hypothetical protein [Listeria portnoyi]